MTVTTGSRGLPLLSTSFAAAPFVLALVRASSGRHDVLMLWMAVASCIGWIIVRMLGEGLPRTRASVSAMAVAVLVLSALLAGLAAFERGAKGAAGVWAVALVLGSCWAANYAIDEVSGRRA